MTQLQFRKVTPALFAAVFLAITASGVSAATCKAASLIQDAVRAYDRAAQAGTPAAFASALARFTDMNGTAMFALGRHRKLLPKAREGEYVTLTRIFMGEFMVAYGKGFRASSLTIVECSDETVSARLKNGSRVTFRVYRSGSRYLVRDVNIKSIWLVQQLRSTFVGTINREGGNIDALFKYLKR